MSYSLLVEAGPLSGTLKGSPSKSQAIRSILFASLARGKSSIKNLPSSPDIHRTIEFCKRLGASFTGDDYSVEVEGIGSSIKPLPHMIDVGNSGLLLRLAAPLLAFSHQESTLTGDASIQNLRPTTPIVEALKQMGAKVTSSKGDDRPPLNISGPIQSGLVKVDGTDSQPVSALLIASTLLQGETEISVTNPGEKPWIDLTLDWLEKRGVSFEREGYHRYRVQGGHLYHPFEYTVPADFGSLAFIVAAALVTQSEVTVYGLDLQGIQADRQVMDCFIQMGAKFTINERRGAITIDPKSVIEGARLDMNDAIDALPIIATLACFAKGKTYLYNAAIARKKESDRIHTIRKELEKMGAKIVEKEDGLVITPTRLIGTQVESHNDHRIAMSLSVAGLGAKGQTLVKDALCIAKSYPNFVKDLISLGAKLRKVT